MLAGGASDDQDLCRERGQPGLLRPVQADHEAGAGAHEPPGVPRLLCCPHRPQGIFPPCPLSPHPLQIVLLTRSIISPPPPSLSLCTNSPACLSSNSPPLSACLPSPVKPLPSFAAAHPIAPLAVDAVLLVCHPSLHPQPLSDAVGSSCQLLTTVAVLAAYVQSPHTTAFFLCTA